CKKLPMDTFFQWNKVYVLDTIQGALIKRVKKSKLENHILCISENKEYEPFDLNLSEVNSLALVVGAIGLE
ncbi:helix-turn-helix transcriptional regulator, partial [Zunongwangia profunda]